MNIKEAMKLSDEQFWSEVSQTLAFCSWICPPQMRPEEIAFRLRDRLMADLDRFAPRKLIAIHHLIDAGAILGDFYSAALWLLWEAGPREQVMVYLCLMGLWEMTP